MLTVYSDDHRLHDAKAEFIQGEMVPSFEMPKRADYILARLREAKLGEIIAPEPSPAAPWSRSTARISSASSKAPMRTGQRPITAMPCPIPGPAVACAR